MPRTIYALEFELQSDDYVGVIIWLEKPSEKVRLINSRKTWLTAKFGDAVLVQGEQFLIKEVRLYRVHPTDANGQTVESGQAWINSEEKVTSETRD